MQMQGGLDDVRFDSLDHQPSGRLLEGGGTGPVSTRVRVEVVRAIAGISSLRSAAERFEYAEYKALTHLRITPSG